MTVTRQTGKAFRGLIEFAEKNGWEVTYTGSGHLKWTPPEGRFVITSSTPSDRRGWFRARADLRKQGLPRVGSP